MEQRESLLREMAEIGRGLESNAGLLHYYRKRGPSEERDSRMKEEYMKRFRPADEQLGSQSSLSSWDSDDSRKEERRIRRETENSVFPPTVRQMRMKLLQQKQAEMEKRSAVGRRRVADIEDFLYRHRKRGQSVEREKAARDEYIKSLLAEVAEDSLPENLNDEWSYRR